MFIYFNFWSFPQFHPHNPTNIGPIGTGGCQRMAPLEAINSQFRTKAKTPRFFFEGSVASFPPHHLLTVRTWSKTKMEPQKNWSFGRWFFLFKGVIFRVPCEFSRFRTYCKHHERPICMCWICHGCHVLSPLAGVTFSEGPPPREIRQDTNHSNDIGCLISFTWPRWQHHHGFCTPGFKGVKFEANKNAYPWYYTCRKPQWKTEKSSQFKKKTFGSLYFETFDLPAIRDFRFIMTQKNKGHNDFNTFHCQTI